MPGEEVFGPALLVVEISQCKSQRLVFHIVLATFSGWDAAEDREVEPMSPGASP